MTRIISSRIGWLLLSLALVVLPVHPLQAQEFEWARKIGRADAYGPKAALGPDGAIYVTGNSAEFLFDVFIVKYDSDGDLLWTHQLEGDGGFGGPYDIAVDAGGNVYTAGSFQGTIDLDPGPGNFSLSAEPGSSSSFISKLDANGDFVWGRGIAGSSSRGIAVDGEGNVHTTGSFNGTVDFDPGPSVFALTAIGAGDIFVLKLDESGAFAWARQMGGESSEMGLDIAVGADGNVFTTGDFHGTVDFDPGPAVFSLTDTPGPPGGGDVFVSGLSGSGDFVWARLMGGPDIDEGRSVAVDGDGNVLTIGRFYGVADFDPGAAIYPLTSAGEEDIFISKLNSSGSFVWAKRLGGTDMDISRDLGVDADGNVFITGLFRGAADFDPGVGVFNLSAVLGDDGFLSKLDSAGSFVWAQHIIGSQVVRGLGVAVGGGDVYASGSFAGVADFNPEAGGFQLTSASQTEAFIAKYADVTANVLPPRISDGGIVLATLLPKVETVSGLSIISVFGEHFTDETILYPSLNENGKIDYMLGGVCLTMNDEPLPIFAVTPGQINAQVSNLQGLGPATFVAVSNCGTSAAISSAPVTFEPKRALAQDRRELASEGMLATVEEATPAFFLFDPVTSDGYIAARFNATESQPPVPVAPAELFPDDSYGPSRPAAPGDIILLFGTGWGPTDANGAAGYPIMDAGEVLPEANPMVRLGGVVMAPEDVLYVGVTPGHAGLYQLAIRVPATAQPGANEVVLTVYGKSTPVGPVIPLAEP